MNNIFSLQNLNGLDKAFVIGVAVTKEKKDEAEEHLRELVLLARNLDVEVVGTELVIVRRPKPKYFVGDGKARDLVRQCRILSADMIMIDQNLSPSQQRNWERLADMYTVDRTGLILEVFARRARTHEARLQIELAREKYALPRLTNAWTHLSRQTGGSATQRDMGEKQIELDRRQVSRNIHKLEKELKKVSRQRQTQRKRRTKSALQAASLVGYTNAGKSTLLNLLSGSNVNVADNLFETLDPTTRMVVFPGNWKFLLTDTIGFIHKLPHLLIESFKATLEEAVLSDFFIHVIDAGSPYVREHYETTEHVLDEIGANGKTTLCVFNKVDRLGSDMKRSYIRNRYPDAVFASFKTGEGVALLKTRIVELLDQQHGQASQW